MTHALATPLTAPHRLLAKCIAFPIIPSFSSSPSSPSFVPIPPLATMQALKLSKKYPEFKQEEIFDLINRFK